jgi:hypothetical protein
MRRIRPAISAHALIRHISHAHAWLGPGRISSLALLGLRQALEGEDLTEWTDLKALKRSRG